MASTWSLLIVSLVTLVSGDQQLCQDLGFSSSLLCSSCDELKEFSLTFLEADCRRCCQRDKDDMVASKVFASAVLEVSFINDRAGKFLNLEVKYKKGADPVLKLLSDSMEVEETLGIDRWTTDTVEEFLNEKLLK